MPTELPYPPTKCLHNTFIISALQFSVFWSGKIPFVPQRVLGVWYSLSKEALPDASEPAPDRPGVNTGDRRLPLRHPRPDSLTLIRPGRFRISRHSTPRLEQLVHDRRRRVSARAPAANSKRAASDCASIVPLAWRPTPKAHGGKAVPWLPAGFIYAGPVFHGLRHGPKSSGTFGGSIGGALSPGNNSRSGGVKDCSTERKDAECQQAEAVRQLLVFER